ncbi:hypothetical protein STRCR_1141 [Streptococcus criceti HS-6]|uniref:Uncharacterized protein n=1 Tax=Streptococcus criceti HS-6 TaxID=873449 RepID=G5JTP4_STRCG|nr:hypothetical protein STRCR_1141 [Streptococcus criceti HS-6]
MADKSYSQPQRQTVITARNRRLEYFFSLNKSLLAGFLFAARAKAKAENLK